MIEGSAVLGVVASVLPAMPGGASGTNLSDLSVNAAVTIGSASRDTAAGVTSGVTATVAGMLASDGPAGSDRSEGGGKSGAADASCGSFAATAVSASLTAELISGAATSWIAISELWLSLNLVSFLAAAGLISADLRSAVSEGARR